MLQILELKGPSLRSLLNKICWRQHFVDRAIQYSTSCIKQEFIAISTLLCFMSDMTSVTRHDAINYNQDGHGLG